MAENKSLVESLRHADETLMGHPSLLGMTMLSYPNYINAMRSTMFTSHLKQFLNLINTEFPHVFTNNENLVGKYSSGYVKAKGDLEVVRKVVKFKDIVENPYIYKLFVFDKKKKMYDVIDREECEDLTENFGYNYNNEVLDSFKEGDTISEGTILSKSSSYDEDMNYGYGKEITVAYTLDPFTSEDAARASRSMSKDFTVIESETIKIGLNNNDYFINLYGKKKGEYKPLPDIGEIVSDQICIIRRYFKNQALSDFKNGNLRKYNGDSDIPKFIDDNVEILDYTIYNNQEEIQDNPFYDQINKYYNAEMDYFNEIVEICEEIFNSGYEYTNDVDYLYKRAKEMLDSKSKWCGDSVFSNLEIEVKIRRLSPLAKGCKVVMRYGNKSVIARIDKDENMPYTHDGRRVDLLINLLGIINRTTSYPLYELFINGAGYQLRQVMKNLCYDDQVKMLFKFIHLFNEEQEAEMYADFKKMKKKDRMEYIDDAINNGIYIHQTPLWETKPIFYRCMDVLKEFPFICEDDLYIKKWGREYKCLTKYFIGTMYCMRLKQSDKRGFSARSTGALDTKSLPTRSFKSKSHLERTSSSCIRFGEFETLNFSIGMYPEDIALFHALYRTSIKGRRDLVRSLFSDDGIQHIDSSYTSRVAEIFQVILKSLGVGVEFIDDDEIVHTYDDNILKEHKLNNVTILATDYQFFLLKRVEDIKKDILEEEPVILESKLQKRIAEELEKREYIIGDFNPEEFGIVTERLKEVALEIRETFENQKREREELNNQILEEIKEEQPI